MGRTRPDYFDYDDWFPCFENPELFEELCFINCQIEREELLQLPNNLTTLSIEECHVFKSSSTLCSLHEVNELKTCSIVQCDRIECLIDLSSSSRDSLPKLEKLSLGDLCNLSKLVRAKAAETQPVASFCRLKTLCMWGCSIIKKLFWVEFLPGLQFLEHVEIENCKQMEKIVGGSVERGLGITSEATCVLPKLKEFSLKCLPELKMICDGEVKISESCLEDVKIKECPKLKNIPVALPLLDNGQPVAPVSLRQIAVGSREWWESVEWDDDKAKDAPSPSVCFDDNGDDSKCLNISRTGE